MQNNQIIVGGRDTGKTTYLLTEIDRLHQEGVNIVVMDSATEHEEKSLLKKTCNNINESVVIDMRDPNGIVIDKVGIQHFMENFMNYFPFAEVVKNRNKTQATVLKQNLYNTRLETFKIGVPYGGQIRNEYVR